MKKLMLSVAFVAMLPGLAFAQQAVLPQDKGLSSALLELTPVLAKNADALGLDATQKAALKDFLAVMPAKRGALEDETVTLRTALRAAVLADKPKAEREDLARQIGANETALVMMRSDCVDHWRGVLNADQFAKLVDLEAAQ